VYKPDVEMVPFWAFPPVMLLTCHVTVMSLEPVTVAWNCCVPAEEMVAVVGEIAIETTAGGVVVPPPELPLPELELPPPQATENKRRHVVAQRTTGPKTALPPKVVERGWPRCRKPVTF
jgi:hypothetical protein